MTDSFSTDSSAPSTTHPPYHPTDPRSTPCCNLSQTQLTRPTFGSTLPKKPLTQPCQYRPAPDSQPQTPSPPLTQPTTLCPLPIPGPAHSYATDYPTVLVFLSPRFVPIHLLVPQPTALDSTIHRCCSSWSFPPTVPPPSIPFPTPSPLLAPRPPPTSHRAHLNTYLHTRHGHTASWTASHLLHRWTPPPPHTLGSHWTPHIDPRCWD